MNNITTKYYIVVYTINNIKYYTLWYESDMDGFVLNADKTKIRTFTNEGSLKEFAIRNNYDLAKNKLEIHCNELVWSNDYEINCDVVLTFWNIISDVAQSIGIDFLGDKGDHKTNFIYDKLFYGCNLPTLKNVNNDFVPLWRKNEKKILDNIIMDGVRILHEALEQVVIPTDSN